MNPSVRFLHSCRITLFTRAKCSLCEDAKKALSDAWDMKPFDYNEIDVMKPDNKKWRDLYEFDTPVIHINHSNGDQERLSSHPLKLMHHFRTDDILVSMDNLLKRAGKSE